MVGFHVGMCVQDGVGNNDFNTADIETRFSVLKTCMRAAFPQQMAAGDLYCFIAPEFFFGNVALPKNDYKKLVSLCGSIASSPNLILVPGSMVAYSGSKRSSKKDQYANRVPVFYGGQLLNYEKHSWGGESAMGGVGTFRNGKDDGLFSVQIGTKKYTFAIEVCMEHDQGVAKGYGVGVDVHIITANAVGYKAANAIGTQYNIRCNADQRKVNNRRMEGGSAKVFDATGKEVAPASNNISSLVYSWDLVLN